MRKTLSISQFICSHVFYFTIVRRPMFCRSTADNLRNRELNLQQSNHYSIGYSGNDLSSLNKLQSNISHRGCINTVKFNTDGAKLLTGSDDRLVKVWDTSKSFHKITLLETLHTVHRGNIFCVNFQPNNENVVLSCAGDGVLCYNDVNNPKFGSKSLMSTNLLMHMFAFDLDQPHVVYTAEEAGYVSRVDLRSATHERIYRNRSRSSQLPVKALCQASLIGSHYIVVAGSDFPFFLFDLRLLPIATNNDKNDVRNQAIKIWSPLFPTNECAGHSAVVHDKEDVLADLSLRSVSVSGLCLSRDGRSILASYQGDQVYEFDIFNDYNRYSGYSQDEPGKYVGAKSAFGGHFNYETFQKSITYFGPNDEYVASGSDSGHLWIWDRASGVLFPNKCAVDNVIASPTSSLASSKLSSTFCEASTTLPFAGTDEGQAAAVNRCTVSSFMFADSRTCNGAAAHPSAPILVSYGIDKDAKVWSVYPIDNSGEDDEIACDTVDNNNDGKDATGPKTVCRPHSANALRQGITHETLQGSGEAVSKFTFGKRPQTMITYYTSTRRSLSETVISRLSLVVHLEDAKNRVTTTRYRNVFDLRRFALNVYQIRKNITLSTLLSDPYRSVDDSPDHPSDVVVDSRMNGLPVRDLVQEILLLLDTPSGNHSSTALPDVNHLGCNIESVKKLLTTNPLFRPDSLSLLSAFDTEEGSYDVVASTSKSIPKLKKFKFELNEDDKATADGVDPYVITDETWLTLLLCKLYLIGTKAKLHGNEAMNMKDPSAAIHFYSKAIRYADYISSCRGPEESSSSRMWTPLKRGGRPAKTFVTFSDRPQHHEITGAMNIDKDLQISVPAAGSTDSNDLTSRPTNIGRAIDVDAENNPNSDSENSDDDADIHRIRLARYLWFYDHIGELGYAGEERDEDDESVFDDEDGDEAASDEYMENNEETSGNDSLNNREGSGSGSDDEEEELQERDSDNQEHFSAQREGDETNISTENDNNISQTDDNDRRNFNALDVENIAEYLTENLIGVDPSTERGLDVEKIAAAVNSPVNNIVSPYPAAENESKGSYQTNKRAVCNLNEATTSSSRSSITTISNSALLNYPISQNIVSPELSCKDKTSIESCSDGTNGYVDPLALVVTEAENYILRKLHAQLLQTTLSNLVAAYINVQDFEVAMKICERLHTFNQTLGQCCDAKFYFRRGTIHQNLGNVSDALSDFSSALALQPNNTAVAKKIRELQDRQSEHKRREKEFCARLFA